MLERDKTGRITGNAFSKGASTSVVTNEAPASLLGRESLSYLLGQQYGGSRDIYTVLGYTKNPDVKQFQAMYNHKGLAAAIVDTAPKTSWRHNPMIADSSDGTSRFLKEWESLQSRLGIYQYMSRADILSGIGRFGVILIGTKDGLLSEPIGQVTANDVIFLAPYSESYAAVNTFVADVTDPRFGKPETYRIRVGGDVVSTRALKTQIVHYSRVIHIAEGLLENEVYGEPRLQKVFNRLEDLDKIVGGSAEGFWQSAAPGYALTPKADFDLDVGALSDAKDEFQNYVNGMQRLMAMSGIDIQKLDGEISDPTKAFDVVLSLISGKTGIPKRILLGSEVGELASTQDQSNFLGRIAERQRMFVTPKIVRPMIQRFIDFGVLPAPEGGAFTIEWPDLFYANATETAKAKMYNAAAIKSMTVDGGEPLVSDAEKRIVLGLPVLKDGDITE